MYTSPLNYHYQDNVYPLHFYHEVWRSAQQSTTFLSFLYTVGRVTDCKYHARLDNSQVIMVRIDWMKWMLTHLIIQHLSSGLKHLISISVIIKTPSMKKLAYLLNQEKSTCIGMQTTTKARFFIKDVLFQVYEERKFSTTQNHFTFSFVQLGLGLSWTLK